MIDSEDDYDYGAHHAAWLAQMHECEVDQNRRMARLAELDASIKRHRRVTQHYEARIARANGRIAWFRSFGRIARRVAALRFVAKASRMLAGNRRMVRTRTFHRGEVAPARRMVLASHTSGDDPAAALISAAVAGSVVA